MPNEPAEVADALGVDPEQGLRHAEAARRLAEAGAERARTTQSPFAPGQAKGVVEHEGWGWAPLFRLRGETRVRGRMTRPRFDLPTG